MKNQDNQTQTNIRDAEKLVDMLLESNDPRLMLSACKLLHAEIQVLTNSQGRSRNKTVLTLMGRLAIKVAELLGDDSPLAQTVIELENEATKLKAVPATAGAA